MQYTFQLPEFLVQNSLSAPTQVFQECGLEDSPSPSQKWKIGQDLALRI